MASVKVLRIRPFDGYEDTLIKSRVFSLPGRKALLKSQMNYEVALVDATEAPTQRPKKTETFLFRKEKAPHA